MKASLGRLCALALFVPLTGCMSTKTQLLRQELSILTAKTGSLGKIKETLQALPNPDTRSDVAIFVSAKTINDALALADGSNGPLEGLPKTRLYVDQVRATFEDGLPRLLVKTWARRGWLRVDLSVAAYLAPGVSKDGESLIFRPLVADVTPRIRYIFLDFRIKRFLRDLAAVELARYAAALPQVSVPITNKIALKTAKGQELKRIPMPDGALIGKFSTPGLDAEAISKIQRYFFLEDGIHVYLTID